MTNPPTMTATEPGRDAMLARLPKPETLLAYASILEKPQYWIDEKTGQKFLLPTGEIIEAACTALRLAARLSTPADQAVREATRSDEGVTKAWMGKNDRGFDFDRIWRKSPPLSMVAAYERAGWEIVPVEIRSLTTEPKRS